MNYKEDLDKFINLLSTKISVISPEETVSVIPGAIYHKIYIGDTGRFLLHNETGNLYFITGYGTPDYEKNFGYLPNIVITDFNYDGYTIVPRDFTGKANNGYYAPITYPKQEIMESENEIGKNYVDVIRYSKDLNILKNNPGKKIPGDRLIVVDIQPKYAEGAPFTIEQFAKSLRKFKGSILYFYNGEGMGLESITDLKNWLQNSLGEYTPEFDEWINNIHFVEKNYGFFRDFLDSGYSELDIQLIFLNLISTHKWSTLELTEEEASNIQISDDLKKKLIDKSYVVAVPNFNIDILKEFDGTTICGGARDECLKELQILMDALGYTYNEFSEFIY